MNRRVIKNYSSLLNQEDFIGGKVSGNFPIFFSTIIFYFLLTIPFIENVRSRVKNNILKIIVKYFFTNDQIIYY